MTKNNKTAFFKNKAGDWWFFGAYSNNFMDRQGEIISWDAHQEYVKWLKTTGVKPPVIFLHQPQFPPLFHTLHVAAVERGLITPQEFTKNLRDLYESTTIAITETVIPVNGFVFVLAKVLPDKISMVEKLNKLSSNWGMSHGFIKLQDDDNIITKYRTFEFTLAPSDFTVNTITPISLKEVTTMDEVLKEISPEDRELLSDALDINTDDLEKATARASEILRQVLAQKSEDVQDVVEQVTEVVETEVTEVVVETETPTEEVPVVEAPIQDALPYDSLRERLSKDFNLEGLITTLSEMSKQLATHTETLSALNKAVVKLAQDEDQKIASQFVIPRWDRIGAKAAEAVEDDAERIKQLKEAIPAAVVEEQNASNPLVAGFWKPIFG